MGLRTGKRKAPDKASKIKGVSWDQSYGKWLVRITTDGKQKHIGRFMTEAEAIITYNKAISRLFAAEKERDKERDSQRAAGADARIGANAARTIDDDTAAHAAAIEAVTPGEPQQQQQQQQQQLQPQPQPQPPQQPQPQPQLQPLPQVQVQAQTLQLQLQANNKVAEQTTSLCFFEEGDLASCDACGQRLIAPVRCNTLVCPNCKHHVRASSCGGQQQAQVQQQQQQQQQLELVAASAAAQAAHAQRLAQAQQIVAQQRLAIQQQATQQHARLNNDVKSHRQPVQPPCPPLTAAEERTARLRSKKTKICEDCRRKCANYGFADERKRRWCASCSRYHPGAGSLNRKPQLATPRHKKPVPPPEDDYGAVDLPSQTVPFLATQAPARNTAASATSAHDLLQKQQASRQARDKVAQQQLLIQTKRPNHTDREKLDATAIDVEESADDEEEQSEADSEAEGEDEESSSHEEMDDVHEDFDPNDETEHQEVEDDAIVSAEEREKKLDRALDNLSEDEDGDDESSDDDYSSDDSNAEPTKEELLLQELIKSEAAAEREREKAAAEKAASAKNTGTVNDDDDGDDDDDDGDGDSEEQGVPTALATSVEDPDSADEKSERDDKEELGQKGEKEEKKEVEAENEIEEEEEKEKKKEAEAEEEEEEAEGRISQGPAKKKKCKLDLDKISAKLKKLKEKEERQKELALAREKILPNKPVEEDYEPESDANGFRRRRTPKTFEELYDIVDGVAVRKKRVQSEPNPPYRSSYRGVSWNKSRGRWLVTIGLLGKQRYLGYFVHEEDAGKCYDKAVKVLRGPGAYLNFPPPPSPEEAAAVAARLRQKAEEKRLRAEKHKAKAEAKRKAKQLRAAKKANLKKDVIGKQAHI